MQKHLKDTGLTAPGEGDYYFRLILDKRRLKIEIFLALWPQHWRKILFEDVCYVSTKVMSQNTFFFKATNLLKMNVAKCKMLYFGVLYSLKTGFSILNKINNSI